MQNIEQITELAKSCVQAFAAASGMGCEFCTDDYEPIAAAGYCCSVCRVCGGSGVSREDCARLASFASKASEREDGKYLYECPLGLSCITSAVLSADGSPARLTAGPFLMEDVHDFLEYDLSELIRFDPDAFEKVRECLKTVPVIEIKKVEPFSRLLMYSAAFLSGSLRNGADYLEILNSGTLSDWESANKIDPKRTVEKALRFMEENYGKDISLSDIAFAAGITSSYLCRLFKKEKGITVNACLTGIRVEKSRELLRTDMPITEIAKLCGFSDQSYFTKVFKQSDGMTPLKYRKNNRNS